MRKVTIEIIHEQALPLLRDLELLQVIRLGEIEPATSVMNRELLLLKGTMTKQSVESIEDQLRKLRDEWN